MARAGQELLFAVRMRMVGRYFGQFCFVIATLNLVTLLVALLYADFRLAACYAAIVLGLYAGGYLLTRLRPDGQMQMNEAMVLAGLVFLVVPLLMTFPLLVTGTPFLDALFETVSAATTTGLSTIGQIEQRPPTLVFARAWMQWYGGLGIVVLSLALIVRPGMSALRLSAIDEPQDLIGGTRAHARRVLWVYTLLSAAGLVLWLLLGGEPMTGLLFILSAVSTGGFAPSGGSLADLDGVRLAWVVTLVSVAGAAPLAVYHQAWRRGWRRLAGSLELRLLLVAGMVVVAMLALNLWRVGMPWSEVLVHAPLMALSAQSTSGFSSLDTAALDNGSKAILILVMSAGGSVGSTAGGFKLLRLLILLGLFYRCVQAMSMPSSAVVGQRLEGRRIEPSEVQDALMIIMLFILTVVCSWLPFLFYGYSPLDALFEVVSATGTVGLSSGVTSAGMPSPLKLILCADMLLGRLEFVAWMIFFYYRTWIGRKRGS